jgi:hypothetical protein
MFEATPGKQFIRAHPQNNQKVKWTEGVAQAVECLLCQHLLYKHEVLNSNTITTKLKLKHCEQ